MSAMPSFHLTPSPQTLTLPPLPRTTIASQLPKGKASPLYHTFTHDWSLLKKPSAELTKLPSPQPKNVLPTVLTSPHPDSSVRGALGYWGGLTCAALFFAKWFRDLPRGARPIPPSALLIWTINSAAISGTAFIAGANALGLSRLMFLAGNATLLYMAYLKLQNQTPHRSSFAERVKQFCNFVTPKSRMGKLCLSTAIISTGLFIAAKMNQQQKGDLFYQTATVLTGITYALGCVQTLRDFWFPNREDKTKVPIVIWALSFAAIGFPLLATVQFDPALIAQQVLIVGGSVLTSSSALYRWCRQQKEHLN